MTIKNMKEKLKCLWYRYAEDIKDYVTNCDECQINKVTV